MEAVETALAPRLASPDKWRVAAVRATLAPAATAVPLLAELAPELVSYDGLLHAPSREEVAHVG